MFGMQAPKSGVQMMVESMVSSLGIDPEEIKASVNKVVQTGVDLSARVSMIEAKIESMDSKLDHILIELSALSQSHASTLPGGIVPAGDDGLHGLSAVNGAYKEG